MRPTIIIYLLVLIPNYARAFFSENGPCKDVTLGDCPMREEGIIQEIEGITLDECQKACVTYAACEIFRFDGTKCLLLVYDYRQECANSAAPVGQKLADCLASSDVACDRIMGEDCDYLGILVYESPPGSIAGPAYCEQFCEAYSFGGCVYWYYEKYAKQCYLYDSKERTCHAVGGPQTPLISQCEGCTTDEDCQSSLPYCRDGRCLGWEGPTSKVWSDEQCRNLGNIGVYDVDECQRECILRDGCTAINYNGDPNPDADGCVLRGCSIPVPKPSWDYYYYRGYFLSGYAKRM